MTKRTQRERLVAALESRGWVKAPVQRTRRYVSMMPTGALVSSDRAAAAAAGARLYTAEARYFVGASGALRYSARGVASKSYPSDDFKTRLLAEVPS